MSKFKEYLEVAKLKNCAQCDKPIEGEGHIMYRGSKEVHYCDSCFEKYQKQSKDMDDWVKKSPKNTTGYSPWS